MSNDDIFAELEKWHLDNECYADFERPQWQTIKDMGRIYKGDNPEYYIDISLKEYRDKNYIVFIKHTPWKRNERPFAVPADFASGFFALFKSFQYWPSNCNVKFGTQK